MKRKIAKAPGQPRSISRFTLYQGLQFLDYFRRLPPSITVTDAFKEWAASKDFDHVDCEAIFWNVLDSLDSALDGPFDSKMSLALDAVLEEGER